MDTEVSHPRLVAVGRRLMAVKGLVNAAEHVQWAGRL